MEELNLDESLNEKKILKELRAQREMIMQNHKMLKSIKRYITFSFMMSILYALIIIIPIVLGILFLPSLLGDFNTYLQSFVDVSDGLNVPAGFDFGAIQEFIER